MRTAATEATSSAGELAEPHYQVRAVAGWLDAHPSTIYRLIESGVLRARRIGRGRGGLRVPRSAWEEFLASSTVRPADDRVREDAPVPGDGPPVAASGPAVA